MQLGSNLPIQAYRVFGLCFKESQAFDFYSVTPEICQCVQFAFDCSLTHWGLVTPFGDIDLGQHWLR